MSVADILQQMAVNAGRAQQQRGAVIGDTIAGLSQVPGQILDDRERQRILDEQRARVQAQDARGAAQEARQAAAEARDQAARDAAQKRDTATKVVFQAATGGDPSQWNGRAAYDKSVELGDPSLVRDAIALHKGMQPELPAITQQDPAKDTYTNGVLTRPAQPKVMTPAEQAQRDETTRHNKETERISALTAGRTEAAQQETARHNRAMEKTADPLGGMGGAGAVDLEKLPPPVRDQAQALVDGRRQLDPRLAGKPLGQTIINAAYAIDPTFDTGNYNARAKLRTDLTSPNGTGGKTVGALNTAIQHAGKLSDLIEKLDNYETPIANAIVNPLRTATGSTAVTNFDTVAPQLAKEIERVWRGAGGTAGEIKDLIETIGHNKGKQQQREALQQFVDLAKGKLDSLEQQRDNGMGKKAGATIPILFESNKPIMDKIAQRAAGTTAAAPAAALAPPAAGRIRITDGKGNSGTILSTDPIPAGWTKQ